MSYRLTKIWGKNFNVFEEIYLDFENKSYLVSGENRQNRGQKSNGAGKSTLLNIIAGSVLGATTDENALKDYIGKFAKKTEFGCTLVGSDTLEITRTIGKSISDLIVLVNGELPKEVPTKQGSDGLDIKGGNEFILKHLETSKEELLGFHILSDKDYKGGFLVSGAAGMLKILNRLINLDSVDDALSKARSEMSKTESGIISINSSIDQLSRQVEYSREDLKREFDKSGHQIEKYDHLLADIEEKKKTIEGLRSSIEDTQSRITTFQDTYQYYDQINQLLSESRSKTVTLKSQLQNSVKCPSCEFEFSLSNKKGKTEIETELTSSEQAIKMIEAEKNLVEDKLQEKKQLEQQLQQSQSVIFQEERFILTTEQQIQSIKVRNENKGTNQQVINKLEEILKKTQSEIQDQSKLLEERQSEFAKIKGDIEMLNKFKFYVANKPLEEICAFTNYFLSKFNTDLSISIEGFKLKSDGSLSQKLNPIGTDSEGTKNFSLFSKGQKARAKVACDLAFIKINNATKKKGGLDFYISDEVTDGLDEAGIESICNSLNELEMLSLIVSHVANRIQVKNQIHLVKENGKTLVNLIEI